MSKFFILYYINTDYPEYSEILGVCNNKEKAINELLEFANYRQNSNGELTQYMVPTKEYESFSYLKKKVSVEMELKDYDIYRICECNLH